MPRPSTVQQLPADLLDQLHALLRDPRVSQLDATARINDALEEQGLPERISKSALNRYKVSMDKVGDRLRQSREIAQVWIAKLGTEPQGNVGELVTQLARTLSFDLMLHMQDGEINAETAPGTLAMLKDLALTAMRLEKASSENVKREQFIREEERTAAADSAVQAARDTGLSDEAVDTIRRKILGIGA